MTKDSARALVEAHTPWSTVEPQIDQRPSVARPRRRAVRHRRGAGARSGRRGGVAQLPDEAWQGGRRHLIEQFHYADAARKVVGCGQRRHPRLGGADAGDRDDEPLMLQLKEARQVGARAGGRPEQVRPAQGQRVVEGQQLLQASSDIFLGWTEGPRRGRRACGTSTSVSSRTGRCRPPSGRQNPSIDGHLRSDMWLDPGPWARALRQTGSRSPAYLGRADTFDVAMSGVRRGLCRPERAGLPAVRGSRPRGADRGDARRLTGCVPVDDPVHRICRDEGVWQLTGGASCGTRSGISFR